MGGKGLSNEEEVIAVCLGLLTCSLQNSGAFPGERERERTETDEGPSCGLFQLRVGGQTLPEKKEGRATASWQPPRHAAALTCEDNVRMLVKRIRG